MIKGEKLRGGAPHQLVSTRMSSLSHFESLAATRYPLTSKDRSHVAGQLNLREEYVLRLVECKTSPAYYSKGPTGEINQCVSQPFMPDDTKGWQTVKGTRNHR
jgi:hypothetical protein